MKKAIYPGSFDPFHEGHLSIVKKALKLFDVVYVVITSNVEKPSQTDIQKRFVEVAKQLSSNEFKDVIVMVNENKLTADFCKDKSINFLIRSARNNIDYNYELELAAANNSLNKNLETVLIIPSYENISYESRLIKQKGSKEWK